MATLARLLLYTLLIFCCGMLVSAKAKRGKKPAAKPAATQQKDGGKVPPPQVAEVWPPKIPLQPNLRFTIRPTLLGLVPPGNEEGYGEAFVRVTSTTPLTVHYEIKEQHRETVGSRLQEQTVIRRGDIATQRTLPQLAPPMLWQTTASWETPSGLLWLRPQDFAQLKSTGLCDYELLPQAAGSPLLERMNAIVNERRMAYGLGARDAAAPVDTKLIVQNWQTTYPAYVNGRRADLPAIRCTDSIRLAHYWVLDDADNPLLLKMTYIAPSLAETDPPLPAEKPADGTLKQDEEQVQAPPVAVQDPAEALIESGAGFAVVNIDF